MEAAGDVASLGPGEAAPPAPAPPLPPAPPPDEAALASVQSEASRWPPPGQREGGGPRGEHSDRVQTVRVDK